MPPKSSTCSVDQIKRFEDQGLLTPRRLNRRSQTGKVHLDIAEVRALARGDER